MKMKRYKCVPTAFAGLGAEMLVILLWAITVFGSGWREWSKGIYLLFAIFMWGACLWSTIWFLRMCHYIYLYPDHLVCKCPFRKSFVLYYDRCIVGMDYATTTGTTRWWIYLSYGLLPKYKGKSPANRINSLRTKPGFVRIQFYEEVYGALLQVLPKHQKVCLQSAYNLHCRDEQ